MSLNLYKYHSNPETISGHDRFNDVLLGIIKEHINFNEKSGEFILFETTDLEDIVSITDNNLAISVAEHLEGKSDIDFYFDYAPDKSSVEFMFDDYFEKHPKKESELKTYLKKEYDYDGEEDIFDFIYENNIDDVISAFQIAYSDGYAIGSEDQMIKDFKSALEKMPGLGYDGDNILSADRYYIVSPAEEVFEIALSLFDVGEILDGMSGADYDIRESIYVGIRDEFKFNEPHYGWNEFDEEAAFERLSDELYEILPKEDK